MTFALPLTARTGIREYFDAFVCYTSENFSFVKQMMMMLEGRHGLKLCITNRDLMPGTAKYTTIAKLIEERYRIYFYRHEIEIDLFNFVNV